MKKRITSLLLTFAMLIAFVPVISAQAANINIGDYVQMGIYYGEPILWRCVAFDKINGYDDNGMPIIDSTDTVTEYKDGYLPLMLSDKIISLKAYDVGNANYSSSYRQQYGSNFWDTSCLSQWLNNEGTVTWKYSSPSYALSKYNSYENETGFLSSFSSEEQMAVCEVSQKTYLNSIDSKYAVEGDAKYQPRDGSINTAFSNLSSDINNKWYMNTSNKFFIIDTVQAKNVYTNLGSTGLFAYPTKSAIDNSTYSSDSLSITSCYTYWLRCPMNTGMSYENVYAISSKTFTYGTACDGSYGVRPAFYLNTESASFTSGSGTESNPYTVEGTGSADSQQVTDGEIHFKTDYTETSIELGEQTSIGGVIDNMYSDLPESDFTITSSNEEVLPIIDVWCSILAPILGGTEYWGSIQAYVRGAAPGESTLTFYHKGEKLGEIAVTVEAQIAETISDATILRAEILNRNDSFDFYRYTWESPAITLNNKFTENSAKSWATAYMFTYELSKALSLSFPDTDKFDMPTYYEAVLTDILENESDSLWSSFMDSWKSVYSAYNSGIVQSIVGEIPKLEEYKGSKLDKSTVKIIFDTIKNAKGEFKDIEIDFTLLDKIDFIYNGMNDILEAADTVYSYSAIQQEKIDILNAIKENTDNEDLAQACGEMIERIKDVHSNVVAELLKTAFVTGDSNITKDILLLSQEVTVDLLLAAASTGTSSAANIIASYGAGKIIMTSSRIATDLILNSTGLSKDIFTISAYADVEREIKTCIYNAQKAFESDKTVENAVGYIATADVFKASLINSCDLYKQIVGDVRRGDTGIEIAKTLLTEPEDIIKNIWSTRKAYDEQLECIDKIKQDLESVDFYSTGGTDIVEYISSIQSTTPSDWATEYVDWGIDNGLLPFDYLRGNYQNNITRAEFCTLLTCMMDVYTDYGLSELIDKQPYNPTIFKDTYYSYVYDMACLGIVDGVSEEEFNPLGEITRQEAATMLMRAAKVLDIDTSAAAADLTGVSDWAKDGVNFVVGKNIMTGTDNGFEPQGTYTKEQAITSMVRFLQNLK